MSKRAKPAEGDPSQHTSRLRETLADAVRQARRNANKTSDPQLRALFETTAEVLDGLIRPCDHAEQELEPAWT